MLLFSAISGQERSGTILKDYYLVPGRKETLLCKGVKMTLFGQLPNKRWRCWVEIDDLITSMNKLITETDDEGNNNAGTQNSLSDGNSHYINSLSKDDLLSRGYPLIGSVPSSLVEELENLTSITSEEQTDGGIEDNFVDMTPPSSPLIGIEIDPLKDNEPALPYSSHARRTPRKTLSQLSFDTFFYNGEASPSSSSEQRPEGMRTGSVTNLHSPLFYKSDDENEREKDGSTPDISAVGSSISHSSIGPSISLPLNVEESPVSSSNNSPVMPVKLREGGFIIKKRLRQKGISIIVGSSSSEGLLRYFSNISADTFHVCQISPKILCFTMQKLILGGSVFFGFLSQHFNIVLEILRQNIFICSEMFCR